MHRSTFGELAYRLDPPPKESAKFETITFTHASVNSHGKFACGIHHTAHSTKGIYTHTRAHTLTHTPKIRWGRGKKVS